MDFMLWDVMGFSEIPEMIILWLINSLIHCFRGKKVIENKLCNSLFSVTDKTKEAFRIIFAFIDFIIVTSVTIMSTINVIS